MTKPVDAKPRELWSSSGGSVFPQTVPADISEKIRKSQAAATVAADRAAKPFRTQLDSAAMKISVK